MSIKSQLKVMVVDDARTSRGLITMALENMGILNYTWEECGADAFRSLAKSPAHLVISDYNMPNGSGLDLLRSVREYAPTSKTGFIIVTASPDKRILQAGAALGLNNFIKKPFTTEQLKSCIETVVGRL